MRDGFTLIEIVVAIAVFIALIALGLFMSMETLRGTLQRSERATIVSLLERSRSRAMNNIDQSPWGVCYLASGYIVFRGTACAAAAAVDTVAANPGATTTGLLAGIVFSQLAGTTTPAVVTVTQNGRTSTLTIYNEGTISW